MMQGNQLRHVLCRKEVCTVSRPANMMFRVSSLRIDRSRELSKITVQVQIVVCVYLPYSSLDDQATSLHRRILLFPF